MKNKTKLLSIILFLSVFIVIISFGQKKAEWKGKIEYENGVKVIKNPEEALYGEIKFELEEDLSIGNEEDENYMFFRGVSVAVDSEQSIYIRDGGNYRIQKFDKNGHYLKTIGKKGQGPGEFEFLSGIYIDSNNNLYVKEQRRISIFEKTGRFKRTIPLGTNILLWGITKDGNVLGTTYTYTSYEAHELTWSLILLNSKGVHLKTIASFPSQYGVFMVDGVAIGGRNPYAPMLFLCPLNGERSLFAWSPKYRLNVIGSEGKILFMIDKDDKPKNITQKEKSSVLESEISFVQRTKHIKLSKSNVEKSYRFPSHKPFFTQIISDDLGNIYVSRITRDLIKKKELAYDLFNQEGYYIYKVIMPSIVPSLIKNGHLFSILIDRETGYSKIKRYKIKNWDQIKNE